MASMAATILQHVNNVWHKQRVSKRMAAWHRSSVASLRRHDVSETANGNGDK